MSTMAEVLAAHQYDAKGCVCTCSDEVQVGLRCDKQTHAEHVADALAEAGYGKLADAWDEGSQAGWSDRTRSIMGRYTHEQEIANETPNPYRSES